MIDLHSHTTESDGTYSPLELVTAARELNLDALAITDHDTFAGYELAKPHAEATGLQLLCGIEISTALGNPKTKTVHLLGYFLHGGPSAEFRNWVSKMQAARRDRNVRLAARLRTLGVDIYVEEVNALGRSMAGRPHFARLLLEKGYCSNLQDAFDKYLDEAAPGYVDRDEPSLEEAIQRVANGGGISSLAHPIRLGKRNHADEAELIGQIAGWGLRAIEAYHSDHTAADCARYLELAAKYGLLVTGGSDFHGANKPSIQLGTGCHGNLDIPKNLLHAMQAGALL
ncbi:MAG: PHP domain-containing protein [Bryobacteraceae bacterium]